MLQIKCIKCENFLTQPGGLLFSPPNCHRMSHKYHFCHKCYDKLIRFLRKNETIKQQRIYS